MGLIKITGLQQEVDQNRDYRLTTLPPSVSIYKPARATFQIYALQLLALTSITDTDTLNLIRQAAEQIQTPENEPWTQFDAQTIIGAAGAPPAPSHVVVTRIPGHSTILIRAATLETPKAQRLVYSTGVLRPTITLLSTLRAEGLIIPARTCLEVPVKLVEDEKGLALAMLLRLRKQRATSDVEDDSETSSDKDAKKNSDKSSGKNSGKNSGRTDNNSGATSDKNSGKTPQKGSETAADTEQQK